LSPAALIVAIADGFGEYVDARGSHNLTPTPLQLGHADYKFEYIEANVSDLSFSEANPTVSIYNVITTLRVLCRFRIWRYVG